MNRLHLIRGFVLVALLLVTPARAQSDRLFQVYGDGPVVNHGAEGSWNATYTDPGAVLFYDGLFHMFYNGFNGWPAAVQIGYATSPDGVTWTKQGDTPVLTTAQVGYAGTAALASSVLVEKDGTWVLYFYTWENTQSRFAPGRIGRATAPKPSGPWQVDGKPVLEPGPAGSWDELRVDAPSVVKTDSGYKMFYGGTDKQGKQMIGLAESADGIHWTKTKQAEAATDPRFAESAPVLRPGESGSWDADLVHQPRVQLTPDGWIMVYRSVHFGSPTSAGLGYAVSSDGQNWTRAKDNPVIAASKDLTRQGFWFTAFAYQAGKYYLYIEAPPSGENTTAVFVATHDGALPGR